MSKYTANGQYAIVEMTLKYKDQTDDEKQIDLVNAFVQVDLYESVFEQAMSGSIAIIDSFNLQDVLPLYGEEKITLVFNTAGNDGNPVEYTGTVYKISEKHRVTEHASGYTIHFISTEAINSEKMVVQRSYEDTQSEIVKKIFNRIKASEKMLEVVDTSVVYTYVFGWFNPLQAISILSKESYSKTNDVGYYFYEDNLQFNYKPLQSLYAQEPVIEYKSRNRGMFDNVDQRAEESANTFQDVKILDENSYLDRIMEGQHGVTSYRFDLFSKSLSKTEYDKAKFYNRAKSLGESPYKKELETSYESKGSIVNTSNSPISLDQKTKQKMQRIEISTMRAEVSVFGDSSIRAGVTCIANLPVWNKDQEQTPQTSSGKYLITYVHHQLLSDKYMQTLMIQKDSYETV
jgi:hypothetical protein